MSSRICEQSAVNVEFTLCGDAFDAFATGDADEEHSCAGQGEVVNCPQCCRVIQEIRNMRYRLKPREEQP